MDKKIITDQQATNSSLGVVIGNPVDNQISISDGSMSVHSISTDRITQSPQDSVILSSDAEDYFIKIYYKEWSDLFQTYIFSESKKSVNELIEIFEWPVREIYTSIINLTRDNEEVSGEVVGQGNIQVNGSAALRRTISGLSLKVEEGALAQDYSWAITDEIRIYQGISNEMTRGIPIYFNLGTYCLSSFSASEGSDGTTINFSGKDRMVLLNGERGGTFSIDTELHIRDLADGTSELIPIPEIIQYVVQLAGIAPEHIHVNIENQTGLELLEYKGSDPLYIFSSTNRVNKEEIQTYTIYGDQKVVFQNGLKQEVQSLNWGQREIDGKPGYYTDYIRQINAGLVNNQKTTRIVAGEVAGYREIPLTFPGELKAAAGSTVVAILDKIVSTFGNEYEYFFDVDGEFYFQKKTALLSMSRGTSNDDYIFMHDAGDKTTPIYTFVHKNLLTSLSRQPKVEGIKNDFTIWGTRSSSSGKSGIPIHARYIIDEPFRYYINDLTTSLEEVEENGKRGWRWKEDIWPIENEEDIGVETKKSNLSQAFICEKLYEMATYLSPEGDYILVPKGKEYYKQFFPDIQYFWREVYNPNEEGRIYPTDPTITSGNMKPTHWYGNDIPFNSKDYANMYILQNEEEQIYTSVSDLIDLSMYDDVYEFDGEKYQSLYNKTNYNNMALAFAEGEDNIITFYEYLFSGLINDNTLIDKLRSFYFRKKGRTGYIKLYGEYTLKTIKPRFEEELWDNTVSILFFVKKDGGTYRPVKKIKTNDNTIYTDSDEELLSMILEKNIIECELYGSDGFVSVTDGTLIFLQPDKEAVNIIKSNIVDLSNYHNYNFYIKEGDSYIPWIEKNEYNIKRNKWRFVTGYNKEEKELSLMAPLDTIQYNKNCLYYYEQEQYKMIQPERIPDGAFYIYSKNSDKIKKPINKTDKINFLYRPCNWDGTLKMDGAITKTKSHPVFVQTWEYNKATGKRLIYEQDQALLPFELVWVVPQKGDELNNCTATKLGDRTLVKNEKSVTALRYTTETPPLYFSSDGEFVMRQQDEDLFGLSSRGISAQEYFKNLIFEHTYCNETANINILPIYYLQPNSYIDIIDKNENDEDEIFHFILNQFSIPLSFSGQMGLTLTRDKLSHFKPVVIPEEMVYDGGMDPAISSSEVIYDGGVYY